jgi:hypothetical protein
VRSCCSASGVHVWLRLREKGFLFVPEKRGGAGSSTRRTREGPIGELLDFVSGEPTLEATSASAFAGAARDRSGAVRARPARDEDLRRPRRRCSASSAP